VACDCRWACGPPKEMKKRLLFSNYCPWKHLLSPLSSRPERTRISYFALRQRPRMRFSSRKPHDVNQRHESRQEIRGSAVERSTVQRTSRGNVFDRGFTGLRPTQGDEKRVLLSNYCRRKHRPPLCHLDRSAPGFPTSRCGNDHVCGFPQETA